jgi:Na+-transporting methylmalonyl-CoA/oxaloacetate decarboxylase gamma subunit
MVFDMDLLQKGLRVSGLGLLGVFSVLIIFYIAVLLLDRIKDKQEKEVKD